MTGKKLWNDGWLFGKVPYEMESLQAEPVLWKSVELPHDWLIYDTNNLYEDSVGWYKKKFEYHDEELLSIIRFEGIYMDATFYLNEKEIDCWKYGYSTHDIDLTDYLVEGINEIKIRVIHVSPNSRWYSGAGIYRNVWLIQKSQSHIEMDGVYITPKLIGDEWIVEIDSEITLSSPSSYFISQSIFDMDRNLIASQKIPILFANLIYQSTQIVEQSLHIKNPKLWDIGQGNLYLLQTQLFNHDEVIDTVEEKFGFRTIVMDANSGLSINGRHVKIKGSCEHHGFGCLGSVANKSAIRRKLSILRTMGVNAIRTAHNMPSTEFMELADEMGFLVDSEAFDMWSLKKTTYDYARFFSDCVKEDVASWIRRDRNHPSIIMWSVGNEIYDMHSGKDGYNELKLLIQQVRIHDYNKHAPITFASNYLRWENTQNCADLVDLVGYNYGEYLYEEHHKNHPEWIIYGSETSSMLASRNIYHFPLNRDILCEDNQQCSALGNCFAGWGAHDYLDNIIADRDTPYSLGQFIWSGFDYFGEPTPYHTRNSYFGQIDTAGFPKDSFFIYQAEWTDYKTSPMVHLFPYWDFNHGQLIDICICSNAPVVELFLNGKSFGKKNIDHEKGKELIPHWTLAYEPGELTAVAYDEYEQVIATDNRHSFGNTSRLLLQVNQATIMSKDDLIFVEISAMDENDYPVENANNRIQIEVTGAGQLIGIDNGDSTDFEQVKGNTKRLFGGKLLAVIAPKDTNKRKIHIKTMSSGLPDAELILSLNKLSTASSVKDKDYYSIVVKESEALSCRSVNQEIPIRKITLLCEEPLTLTKENPCIHIHWKIDPPNASYHDLQFKIVDDIGIEVKIASLKHLSDEVIVSAKADGNFQLRCIAMNGGKIANVRSILPIAVSGFGTYYVNPYERISAGLCMERPAGLSEGEDHGVRFLGKEETYISYENLDFGTYGTQDITLEIFKYVAEPVNFQIYEEDEQNHKTLLLDGYFAVNANWLEFFQQTYTLNRKICSIKKISIVSKDNFQLKNLVFHPICHGLERIFAKDYNEIFGDQYQIEENAITNIGNNVTLSYHDMNFGDRTVTKLVICGRSDLDNNSIHVKIKTSDHSSYELVEFPRSTDFVEHVYSITPVSGNTEIRFIFLPGSQFDFKWLQFWE